MPRIIILLLIWVVGASIFAPLIMQLDLDPMPGDFTLTWANQHYPVPVLWSLCASGALALFYSILKR
jgi:hypothetical protein